MSVIGHTIKKFIINPVKRFASNLSGMVLKIFRLELLDKEQTIQYLEPYLVINHPETQMVLPTVPNRANLSRIVFDQVEIRTSPGYVWNYNRNGKPTSQLAYGAILTDRKLLCTDFPSYHLNRNFITRPQRTSSPHATLMAPWSHYQDGVIFGGYYDFVMLVAAKLCRMKEALNPAVFENTVVAYPLFNTSYEQEMLALIGFAPDRILDSREQRVRFDQCILGNSGHWFYPNPADIRALKKNVEGKLKPRQTPKKRIYISRAGRRRVINEASLLTLLKKYDFTIIDDKPRSVAEQVEIYKNASFIMGPHGASFTNVIWCEPGTHLFELFSPTMIVPHFLYLAQLMQMQYSAYHHVITLKNKGERVEEDIFVSIADLEKILDELLPVD